MHELLWFAEIYTLINNQNWLGINMKKAFFLILVLVSNSLYSAEGGGFENLQHAILVNVNSRKITRKDLNDMGAILFRMNFPDRPMEEVTEKEIAALSASALRELVIMNLVEDEVKTLNSDDKPENDIDVDSEMVARQVSLLGLDKLIGKPLTMRFAKSRIMLDRILMSRGMTMNSSPRSIINFYNKHRRDIFVTRRMVKVRHIFLSEDALSPDTTKKQASMLYDELKKMPQDKRYVMFPKMAKDFSQDRFKANGGLLDFGNGGWFPQDHDFVNASGVALFPEGMLRGIRSLTAKGDVKLSKSANGWHILMLEDAKGGRSISIRRARTFIEDFLSQRKVSLYKINWLGGKVDRSEVIWNDGDKFPREKILFQMGQEQELEFLRMRVQRAFDSNKRAPH